MRYLIAILPIMLFTGCMGSMYTAKYDIGMEQVERPSDIEKRYGEAVITKQDTADVSKYIYADSLISIAWLPYPKQFEFVLENKSEHTMKLIWDESAFVDSNGQSHRIMHKGVKFTERNNSMPPSIVVRGGMISDLIYPSDYVSWEYSSWVEKGIFEPWAEYSVSNLQPAKDHVGKSVQVLLPIEIEGNVNEYIFTFKVNDVELPQAKTY